MKKFTVLFLLFFLITLILAAGCTAEQPAEDPEEVKPISGLIYEIEGSTFLVVSGIEDVNIPRRLWFEEGKRAVYFAIDENTVVEQDGEPAGPDILERGQKANVWHEGFLAESYPEQGKAVKIVIIENTPAGDYRTDSGRYMARLADDQIEIKISGVPDELPARIFSLTDEAAAVLDQIAPLPEEEIIFRYLPGDETEGLIFDLHQINN